MVERSRLGYARGRKRYIRFKRILVNLSNFEKLVEMSALIVDDMVAINSTFFRLFVEDKSSEKNDNLWDIPTDDLQA